MHWEDKTVSCCATNLLGKTAVTFNKVIISTPEPVSNVISKEEDVDSDDYEKLEQFSPVYLSIILICSCAIIVALESIRDCMKNTSSKMILADPQTPKLHEITEEQAMNHSDSMYKSQ